MRERGYFEGKDREGNWKKFPIASFSLAVVEGKGKSSLYEVSKLSAELKRRAKAVEGSAIALSWSEEVLRCPFVG